MQVGMKVQDVQKILKHTFFGAILFNVKNRIKPMRIFRFGYFYDINSAIKCYFKEGVCSG